MSLTKKIILIILSVVAIGTVSVTVFGMRIYLDAQKALSKSYKPIATKEENEKKRKTIKATKPFSILLMGLDTGLDGDAARQDKWAGRSDSMMVVTINPKEKQTTMFSIDRDILAHFKTSDGQPVLVEGNAIASDKLNHSYAYGREELNLATVNNLLGLDITYYATINMNGLRDLVDAVGGIDVENKFDKPIYIWDTEPEFREEVPVGKQHIDGAQALVYARMRHFDPEGDVGRQKRQREVVQKVVQKLLSVNTVNNYQKVFDAVSNNVKTDIDFETLLDVVDGYQNSFKTIKQYQLQGDGSLSPTNGVYYQYVSNETLLETRKILAQQLELPTPTLEKIQEEVANGTLITYEGQFAQPGNYIDPDTSKKKAENNSTTSSAS